MSGYTIVQYVIDFLTSGDLHPTIVSRFVKSAECLRTKVDIEKWLKSVKNKIGRVKYLEMKLSFSVHVKKDAGFETMSEENVLSSLDIYRNILLKN